MYKAALTAPAKIFPFNSLVKRFCLNTEKKTLQLRSLGFLYFFEVPKI